MEAAEKNESKIRVSSDEMEAYLTLNEPEEGIEYTLTDVQRLVEQSRISYGIDHDALEHIIRGKIYNREVCIAKGVQPVDGRDGYFVYNFNMDLNGKPTVREDGSVDYWSVHNIEMVEEGQVIATYHDPIEGSDGVTVLSRPVKGKRGRPQPPLVGRGFTRSEDGYTYTADFTGKIEMQNNRIQVSSIYEVSGDVDLHTGNIDFRGDVVVHGNVTTGAVVKATGTITVDGICEACTLEAGKSILLRGGVLGGDKAVIRSKGDIQAKFFEYCTVEAEGCIRLNSALNCKMTSFDKIYLDGKHAGIVGGDVYATSGLEADTLGNINEVKTQVRVGASPALLRNVIEIENRLGEANGLLKRLNDGLKQFEDMAKAKGMNISTDERRVALLRAKLAKQAEIATDNKALERLNAIVERGKDATVQVLREVYPNTVIVINQSTLIVKDEQKSILFKIRNGNVVMLKLGDVVA
ncbi:MAG: FapA family protein [Muribaculaceae bacterium]|nr:FapA family protein [Roseburia sp.]MCM1432041.1 FapA family protein [Muribaculaceae bacterium]MCM1493913.1 FapA family protein [Muribaculaceae bacterium]